MPRMDGVAATRAIRDLTGRPGRVPIIALTANADPEDAAAYLSAGMNGVVEKPMKPENLLQALQQALADSAAAAQAA
jgi:CheY-like chemotaxis protein